MAKPQIVIVGGGIGGCTAAIALNRAGADVTIYESARQLLEIGAGINVQAVAIGALSDLGIPLEKFRDAGDGITTSKIQYFTNDGVLISQEPVGLAAGAQYPQMSVHRAKFHNTLVAECRKLLGEDRVLLNSKFCRFEKIDGKVIAHFVNSTTKQGLPPVTCDLLVGCDGLKSVVRSQLLGETMPRYTGRTIYRGLCEVDSLYGDGETVGLCGDEVGNFILYPVSNSMRKDGKFHCNWGFNASRQHPGGVESWTSPARIEEIRDELALMDGNNFGGLSPLQIAEKTEKIIGWALFDRDPLATFDFGSVTLLGDAAHPLLPFGSQGATQAIMDGEALGICLEEAMKAGTGVVGCVKLYSEKRCAVSGQVVIANRTMGSTAVLRVANEKTKGMAREEKERWCKANGDALYNEVIKNYRNKMPTSVRPCMSLGAAQTKSKVVIVGGGIGGCTAAIALHKAGADVTIYESARQLLEIGAGINVQAVAIGALSDLGIPLEKFRDAGDGITTSKLQYFTNDGVLISQEPVGLAAGAQYPQMSVHRAKFHNTLVAECRKLLGEDRVLLNSKFCRFEKIDGKVIAHFVNNSTKQGLAPVTCDLLVGCDGLKSVVRSQLLGEAMPRYTGRTIYRGLCEVDSLYGDGETVGLCGDEVSNFILYPVSNSMRKEGKFHCNWGFNASRPHPGGAESWTSPARIEEIRDELAAMDGNKFGGLTPLQIAEKTQKIIGWALFDRDPLATFDFGTVTLLGDAAHPLLPFGSQGATQAIMDGEALGICFEECMEVGTGVEGCVKLYSEKRCEVSGKVVIANRTMGSTAVLRVANEKCRGMTREEQERWCKAHGDELYNNVIKDYRSKMPQSVRPTKRQKI